MSLTIGDLIRGALRKVEAVSAGEEPTADEYQDGLDVVNNMLRSWSTEQWGIHAVARESFTLTAAQAEYTYGSGGDFDSSRPMRILGCYVNDNNNDSIVAESTFANYARINNKSQAGVPELFLHNAEYATAKIVLWPVPDSTYSISFQSAKPLAEFTNKSDSLNLPPEYREAIEYSLAVRIAAEYGKQVAPSVAEMASYTMNQLRILHAGPVPAIRQRMRQTGNMVNIQGDE